MQAIEKQTASQGLTFVSNAPMPKLVRPDEVLIRIQASAICGTDVDIYRADAQLMNRMKDKLPVITGHEFCGMVEDAGADVRGLKVGDFVSAEMHVVCGHCYNCRMGNGQWCLNTVVRGIDGPGIFAEYVVLPSSNVIKLPPEIPVEVAAFLDAIGNAVHTVRSVDVTAKDVAILGAGPMGIMAVALCRLMGARKVYVTDVFDALLDEALREGADAVFNVKDEAARKEFVSVAKSDPTKRGVDVVMELSGHGSAYRDAFDVIRMGGEMSLLGLPRGEVPVSFSRDVVFKGLTIRGITGRKIFATWVEMLALLQGPFLKTAKQIVTHKFPLAQFEDGFAVKLRGEGLKVILYPNSKA
jgi:threonine 3-dehydrogenase